MQKPVTCGIKVVDLPICFNDLHVPMFILNKLKMN
jgi:hypothetical protein